MSADPTAALVLVDLQQDFLGREGLVPGAQAIVARAAALLAAARRAGIPVAHAQTRTRADGTGRMPHWTESGIRSCVDGTPGAEPPPALAPRDGEGLFRKAFYGAFRDPALEPWLRERGVGRIVIAGVYLHACVRSTALEAYERGFAVAIAEDAVGSTDPLHAEATRAWLEARAAHFVPVEALAASFTGEEPPRPAAGALLPVAVVGGRLEAATSEPSVLHRDPARREHVLAVIPIAGAGAVERAARSASVAQRSWAALAPERRAERIRAFADALDARRDELVALTVREVAKPIRFAEEEIGRAVAHARIAADLVATTAERTLAPGVRVALRPHGVVGIVTPWNNPVAIPVGKVAPALAFGNAVVWKPAPEASRIALAVLEALAEAGVPAELLGVVLGDARTARAVALDPRVAAVSITGSIEAGQAIAAICARGLKPLQAELGGNNAAIVLADADLAAVAADLALAAYGFSGQRCTAIRRFVVEAGVADRFEERLVEAIAALRIGEPADPATDVGPLVSLERRERVREEIAAALGDGARLVRGGEIPRGFEHGAWLEPTLLADARPESRIVRRETFGPVAVIQRATDLEHAIALANDVTHGLVLAIATANEAARQRVLEAGEAGIVQLGRGPLAIDPRAPFSGWKASGLGPPEHGEWDLGFYTRVQARYEGGGC